MNNIIHVCTAVKLITECVLCCWAVSWYSCIKENSSANQPLFIRDYTEWPPPCWCLAPQLSAPPAVHLSVLPAPLKERSQGMPAPSPALQPGPHPLPLAYSAFPSSAAQSIPRSRSESAAVAGSHPRAPCTWQMKRPSVKQQPTHVKLSYVALMYTGVTWIWGGQRAIWIGAFCADEQWGCCPWWNTYHTHGTCSEQQNSPDFTSQTK